MNRCIVLLACAVLAACTADEEAVRPIMGESATGAAEAAAGAAHAAETSGRPFSTRHVATMDEPWAMTFLPDGRMLITEKAGRLIVVSRDGDKSEPVAGVPEVDYGGQGGLGDVVLHPDYESNSMIYLSYAEAGDGNVRGAAVMRATLELSADGGALTGREVVWRQVPKVSGRGHYGHRIAFDDQGYLFISSGERQKFDPAQDMRQNLGKIVRLRDNGSIPEDNPFHDQGGVAAQIWSLGHRNPLGLAFAPDGRLWEHEMGPRGGDELNLIVKGENYGYPIVSNGDHYSGKDIPDHYTRPEFYEPKAYWVPVISPGGLIIYTGSQFPAWQGNALIAGLSSESLVRVTIDGDTAVEAERFDMGERIREIEQGPDGNIWLLQDGAGGRLLELTPAP